MKGFFKASRAGFAILLAMCMVMSLGSVVSADGSAEISSISTPVATDTGYYSVTISVSGIADGGDATILIYKAGEQIDEDSVKYVNQVPTSEGAATFTAEIPGGSYTVMAGGTGVAPDEGILDANTPPAFEDTEDDVTISEDSAIGTEIGTYTATDYDGDDLTYSLDGDDAESFDIDEETGEVTTAEEFDADEQDEYTFEVWANDGTATSSNCVTVTVTIESVTQTIASLELPSDSQTIKVDGVPTLPTTISYTTTDSDSGDIAIDDWTWDSDPVAVEGIIPADVYTATPDFTLPANLELGDVVVPDFTLTVEKYIVTAFGEIPDEIPAVTGTAQEDLELPNSVEVTFDTEETISIDIEWSCSEGYDPDVEGEYIFVPDVSAYENMFDLDEGLELPSITVILEDDVITITGFEEIAPITDKYVETAQAALGLPEQVEAIYADDSVMLNVIGWTCAAGYNATSTEEQVFTAEVDLGEGYELDEGVDAPTVSVTLKKYAIKADYNFGTKKVSPSDTYEAVIATLPTSVEVEVDGSAESKTVSIIWPEDEPDFPPAMGETISVEGEFVETGLISANGKIVVVVFQTVDTSLGITVDGKSDSVVIVKAGEDALVEASYYDETAEFGFVVTGKDEEADPGDAEFSSDYTYAFGNDVPVHGIRKVTVFVKVDGEITASASVLVIFAASLYDGAVYIDATNEKPTYSALRVNKNAGMTVRAAFRRYDNDPIPNGSTYTVEIRDKNGEVVAQKDLVDGWAAFSAEDLAALSPGPYKVAAILKDSEGVILHEVVKTANIGNIGVWYTSMKTNGKSGNINVNKSKALTHEIAFDDLPYGEELYVGYDVVAYNTTPADKALGDRTTGGYYKYEDIDVSGKGNGAYSIFSLAKKTDSQDFYDFCFGRTIYVRDSVATVCNIELNGSRSCTLAGADTLTVAPVWAVGALRPAGNVSYEYSFYEYDASAPDKRGNLISFGDQTVFTADSDDAITITNTAQTDLSGSANIVVITVLIDGEEDMELQKLFYKN